MSDRESGDTVGLPNRHRLSELLGMHVVFADGRDGDQVTDVRLVQDGPINGRSDELVVSGFIVGRRRPGTLFGYDRHPSMGPWVLRLLVRFLHRRTGYLTWDDVAVVEWDRQTLRLRVDTLRPLAPS
jgi:hypothetical protein